jgi:hypothetical protein
LEFFMRDLLSSIFRVMRTRKSESVAVMSKNYVSLHCESVVDPYILDVMKYFLLSNDEKDVCKCSATPLQDSDPKDFA